jgi:hypothetical protein
MGRAGSRGAGVTLPLGMDRCKHNAIKKYQVRSPGRPQLVESPCFWASRTLASCIVFSRPRTPNRATKYMVTVAELMGHARLETTRIRIYTLPTRADRERAIEALPHRSVSPPIRPGRLPPGTPFATKWRPGRPPALTTPVA